MPVRKSTKKASNTKAIKPVVERKTSSSAQDLASQWGQRLKNPKVFIPLIVVILAILAFIFKGLFIAALVNGQPISRMAVIHQLEQQNGKTALDQLVTQTLIYQEASKKHISVNSSEVNGQISQIENSLKSQGVTLDQALAARGMTQSDLYQQIELQLLINKLVGPVSVSDKEIQDYIAQNKDQLPQGLSADQLNAQVKQQLEQQKINTKAQSYVAQLQKNAKITYFVNY